ncbi:MAG: hypothetical protein GYB31_11905 [Bacteroidetes bacterium]|nr:hypothetical protein [Bacteroidota bacterium]
MKNKEYSNGEVTIVWKPELCIHSANCVKGLPEVFNTEKRPWINAEGAGTQAMIDQVKKCPSGALSFYMNEEDQNQEAEAIQTEVEISPNGPLIVKGEIKVCHPDGKEESKTRATAFCRCGQSANKPYCDGTHRKVEFIG